MERRNNDGPIRRLDGIEFAWFVPRFALRWCKVQHKPSHPIPHAARNGTR